MIPSGERLNFREERGFYSACQYEMTVDPTASWRQLRKGHADLEGDSCPFREDGHGSVLPQGCDEVIKDLTDDGRLACKVRLELVPSARM